MRGDVWKCLLGISIEIGDSIELLDYRDIFQTNSPELRSLRNGIEWIYT